MKKALVIDPFSGASGDMFLGAFVDMGVPLAVLEDALARIPALARVKMAEEKVTRGAFTATQITVDMPDEHAHRSLSIIRDLIGETDLDESIKQGAVDTFTRLAKAEAKVHGRDIEDIHFHEVGALDAIADIVGTHAALHHLGLGDAFARPTSVGSGTTTMAHGDMPLPAPATLELLAGFPVSFVDAGEELTTPTGAALIASIAQPLGSGTLVVPERIGYGAGARDSAGVPNVLRVLLAAVDHSRGHVCIVTSTLDDMNPELYGYVMEQLFDTGALEVYFNPVMMKKNRPGVEVTLISEERDVYTLANLLMANTTTIGVRIHREERIELPRRKDTVETAYGVIEVKIATRPDGKELVSPEFESCKRAAREAGASLLDVYEAARRAWGVS